MCETMDIRNKIRFGVIGGSQISKEISKIAWEVGRLIAENRGILICGGLGGVMESACKGAKEAGGLTIGILPGRKKEDANPYVDIAIPTGLGEARNMLVIFNSDAVIAIDGSYGTLIEISYALLHNKPVFGIKTWHLYQDDIEDKAVIHCHNPQEAVSKAIQAVRSLR